MFVYLLRCLQMAEFDTWYVFGVDKVINTLAVRE